VATPSSREGWVVVVKRRNGDNNPSLARDRLEGSAMRKSEGVRTLDLDQLGSLIDIRRHDLRVVTSGNCCAPLRVLGALDELLGSWRLHLLNAPHGIPDRPGVMLETCFVGAGMRHNERLVYFPMRLSQVPMLYERRLGVDIVVAHTSVPHGGSVSLGLEVNVLPAAIAACRKAGGVVIAQVNPQMPYTFGDGELPLDTFDAVVEVDEPVLTHEAPPTDERAAAGGLTRAESAQIIGDLVARRVPDGATLQLGIGEIPDAALDGLRAKHGLAIWSEVIGDGVLELDQAGALDPTRPIVTSAVLGSAEFYAWAHRNERLRVLRTETTNAPSVIARNRLMTSVNTALQVDLFDQANASRIGSRIFSGFGGQTDFTVGAIHAAGGQALMALRSWHPSADASTIVPQLSAPVTSFQHTAVITEQGVAELALRDEKEQAVHLVEHAAHPDARDELWEQALSLGLV